jgi:hypothetical protein
MRKLATLSLSVSLLFGVAVYAGQFVGGMAAHHAVAVDAQPGLPIWD